MEENIQEPTEEERKDLEARVKGFNGELILLLGKYKMALTARSFLTPDGRIAAGPHIVDDSKRIAEEAKAKEIETKPEATQEAEHASETAQSEGIESSEV